MKATFAFALCLASSACSVAELPATHDVEVRDTRGEVDADSADGSADAPVEVALDTLGDSGPGDADTTVGVLDVQEVEDAALEAEPDAAIEIDDGDVDAGDASGEIDAASETDDSVEDVAEVSEDVAQMDVVAPDTQAETQAEDSASSDTDTSDVTQPDISDASETVDAFPLSDTSLACNTTFAASTPEPSPHVPTCSAVAYTTNPPTSGPHYPIWAAFKTYAQPVNPGFLVHSMEHGAVVIHHRCGDAQCAAELAELATFLAARPADPLCLEPVHARVIVTPSIAIDTRFAVSAWGASLRSDCFDLEALGTFLDLYYAKAPENLCSDGVDLDAAEVGSALYCPPTLTP